MARTFAAALVADVKTQRGNVLAAINKLHHEMAGHLQVGNVLAAQAKCAEMFTLYPAVLSANAFLNHACTVDLDDDPRSTQMLLSPLVQTAVEQATTVTAGRATGAVGVLAHHYNIETLAEMAKNTAAISEQFFTRTRKGELAEKVLDELFEGRPAEPPFNTGASSDAGLGAQPN